MTVECRVINHHPKVSFGFRVVEILEQNLDKFGTGFWGSYYAWADLKSNWYGRGACELTCSAIQKCQMIPWFMKWTKWTKMNFSLKSPEMSWNQSGSIGIDTGSIPEKFGGSSMPRKGSKGNVPFWFQSSWDFGTGLRQIWNRLLGNYYAWADLKSIWYGGEACELTFSAT